MPPLTAGPYNTMPSRVSQRPQFVAPIRPRVESDLGFRVAGKVVKRMVQTGQKVKAGEALAALDEQRTRAEDFQRSQRIGTQFAGELFRLDDAD